MENMKKTERIEPSGNKITISHGGGNYTGVIDTLVNTIDTQPYPQILSIVLGDTEGF